MTHYDDLRDNISRKVSRYDRIADVIIAVILGVLGAAALVHWWAR